MLFEFAGFLCGVSGIAAAFWLLYRRESSRVMQAIYSGVNARQRG